MAERGQPGGHDNDGHRQGAVADLPFPRLSQITVAHRFLPAAGTHAKRRLSETVPRHALRHRYAMDTSAKSNSSLRAAVWTGDMVHRCSETW